MNDNNDLPSYDTPKGYFVLIGSAVLTLMADWGVFAFFSWLLNGTGLSEFLKIISFALLAFVSFSMLILTVYIPSKSVSLAHRYAHSGGLRYIVFGVIGIACSIIMFFVLQKEYRMAAPLVYCLIVLVEGIKIAKKK